MKALPSVLYKPKSEANSHLMFSGHVAKQAVVDVILSDVTTKASRGHVGLSFLKLQTVCRYSACLFNGNGFPHPADAFCPGNSS